jgi:hypothetical protein
MIPQFRVNHILFSEINDKEKVEIQQKPSLQRDGFLFNEWMIE